VCVVADCCKKDPCHNVVITANVLIGFPCHPVSGDGLGVLVNHNVLIVAECMGHEAVCPVEPSFS